MLSALFRVRYGAEMRTDRKTKILFMIDYVASRNGGTEGQLSYILSRLDRSRFEPFLCCLWPTPWIQDHSPPCDHIVLFRKPVRWVSAAFSIPRLRNFVCSGQFDIVHTFFPTSNVLGALAARLASVPTILSSRRDLGYWKRWQDTILLRAVRGIPTCYVANSYAVKKETAASEGIDPSKIIVIHNGVDVQAYERDFRKQVAAIKGKYHVLEDELVVGVVANFHRRVKGVDKFIEAAGLVAAEIENVRFFVVGKGNQRQEEHFRNRLRQLQLSERFMFTGEVEDVRPFLCLFDVGVLPSLSEGFSNSLMEYMAAGLPAVATDVGGNRELITDGQCGFLVSPASPHALAQKIVLFLKDAQLRQRIGRNARHVVKSRFSVETMIKATESLYESVSCSGSFQKKTDRGFLGGALIWAI